MTDPDKDFACLCAAVFSGDPRFWQAVDRYEILNKKVKMVVDFNHSLHKEMTEPYFRALAPYPSELPAHPRYIPGDVVLFPNGGKVIGPGNPPKSIIISPGGSCLYGGTEILVFNPLPNKKRRSLRKHQRHRIIRLSCYVRRLPTPSGKQRIVFAEK